MEAYTIEAHETEFRGVLYRSKLEARWARLFTHFEWPFTYEAFPLDGWLPDFHIEGDGCSVLIEVKPHERFFDLQKYWAAMNKSRIQNTLILLLTRSGPKRVTTRNRTEEWNGHKGLTTVERMTIGRFLSARYYGRMTHDQPFNYECLGVESAFLGVRLAYGSAPISCAHIWTGLALPEANEGRECLFGGGITIGDVHASNEIDGEDMRRAWELTKDGRLWEQVYDWAHGSAT